MTPGEVRCWVTLFGCMMCVSSFARLFVWIAKQKVTYVALRAMSYHHWTKIVEINEDNAREDVAHIRNSSEPSVLRSSCYPGPRMLLSVRPRYGIRHESIAGDICICL